MPAKPGTDSPSHSASGQAPSRTAHQHRLVLARFHKSREPWSWHTVTWWDGHPPPRNLCDPQEQSKLRLSASGQQEQPNPRMVQRAGVLCHAPPAHGRVFPPLGLPLPPACPAHQGILVTQPLPVELFACALDQYQAVSRGTAGAINILLLCASQAGAARVLPQPSVQVLGMCVPPGAPPTKHTK